jgi:cell division protein DivIC
LKLLAHIPSWLKNKYLLTGTFFLVWMFFFDPKDVTYNWSITQKYKDLQKSEHHLDQQIAETKKEQDLLKTNAQTIEKYARENYLMKKDNEDLFILNSPSEPK